MHTLKGGAVVVAVATFSAAAAADQVVVFDSRWTHTADIPDSHYRLPPAAGSPSNWVAPVDYSKGSAHVYLEVFTKPTDTPTKFQVCFEGTPTYGCTNQSPTYTTTGVLDWGTPFDQFYVPPGEAVDWTKGTKSIAVILKDTMNGKPSAGNVGATTAALYTPTEVRVVVTLVSAGAEYVPPGAKDAGTGPGTDVDSGGDAASLPVSSGGTSGNGGVRGASGTSGAGGSPASGGSGPKAAGGSSPAGVPDAAASGGAAASSAAASDDGSCALASRSGRRSPSSPWAAGLALASLGLVRRRRFSISMEDARGRGAIRGRAPHR